MAGNGISGYSGDGGAATSAELGGPVGVATDAAGNIYIAEYNNNRIRKVTAATGIISTVAGNGTSGFSGDGGAATSAELDNPSGVALDSAGNIYIVDSHNGRIRVVNAGTGKISTIAGGATVVCTGHTDQWGDGCPATQAIINFPYIGVAVDSKGNVYIGDYGDQIVREVSGAGTISRIAGTGTGGYNGDGIWGPNAEIAYPEGVTVDASGDVYIADLGNNRIRRINAVTGIISTLAGTGTAGYSGDGGAATFAEVNEPQGVALDPRGNIYIADTANNRIRIVGSFGVRIPTSGDINTVAGDGTAGYSGDNGIATNAEVNQPQGVAVDSSGNIYIADTNNNRIRLVLAQTGIITTVAGNGTAGFSGDGGTATSAELHGPRGVAVDAAGNIYIADTSNNRIRKVTIATGAISTVAGGGTSLGDGGPATSAQLSAPAAVSLDGSGNFYIADRGHNRIREVTVSTGIINTVAGNGTGGFSGDGGAATSAELNSPSGVAVDSSGNLYITDSSNQRIRKVKASTGIISTVAGDGVNGFSGNGGAATSAELSIICADTSCELSVDSAFNIYIVDFGNDQIRKVTASTGIITTIAGDGTRGFSGDGGAAINAELFDPTGVAVDGSGNIYIADEANDRIRVVGH